MNKNEVIIETYYIALVEHTFDEAKEIIENMNISIIYESKNFQFIIDKRMLQGIIIKCVEDPTKYFEGITKAHSFSNDLSIYFW